MTATTTPPSGGAARPLVGDRPDLPRAGLGAVMHSEWIKLRTVRSTVITLSLTVVLGIGEGTLISLGLGNAYKNDNFGNAVFDPTSISLGGLASFVGFAQLSLIVLGVLVVTSEYSTGMIRTSLAAVPRRGRLLAAKALVFALVALVVGEITGFVAFFVGQVVLAGQNAPHAVLSDPHVARAVMGSGLYLALVGLVAVGVGGLIRNTAGAIFTLVAVIIVLPPLSNLLPASVGRPLREFWPTEAGSQIISVHRSAHSLGSWAGLGVLLAFATVVMALGAVSILRRDA
ncbi:MAG: ABC transporter permease subunit [Actinomycetota bacterium]|nr:ABC transporter permease subunit [Actinomycetota bacterium]